MPQPIFLLECRGTACECGTLMNWLCHDLPCLARERGFLKFHLYDKTWLKLYISKPDPLLIQIACVQFFDLDMSRNVQLTTMFLQDVFCSLERRGFEVKYCGGTWAGHNGEFIQYNQRGG